MKDLYETPVMEIVPIDEKDIIFASEGESCAESQPGGSGC